MGYDEHTLFRYLLYSLSLLILLSAVFGVVVGKLDLAPGAAVVELTLGAGLPARVVLGGWLLEATGLAALVLLIQGRCATWWLDGLVAGWVGWIFRGPVLVVTLAAAGQSPRAWWPLVLGWLGLYSIQGLVTALIARNLLREDRVRAGIEGG